MPYDLADGPAARVIKGEIHNVLSIIRSDPRYASPQRFRRETTVGDDRYDDDGDDDDLEDRRRRRPRPHPVLRSLRELSDRLSRDPDNTDVVAYVSPFAAAIVDRGMSSAVTGAALSSLHKFLLYGFITGDSPRAKDGITIVARSVRHCTFEESSSSSATSSDRDAGGTTMFSAKQDEDGGASRGRRGRRRGGRDSAAMHIRDEEVVMKLLSLSALVIRSEVGTCMLEPHDVVGVFRTCLHVSCHARNASSLLRSAANDTLQHIVLVVSGRGLVGTTDRSRGDDDDDDDDCLSDDLWAEADVEAVLPFQRRRATTTTMTTTKTDNTSLSSSSDNREYCIVPSVTETNRETEPVSRDDADDVEQHKDSTANTTTTAADSNQVDSNEAAESNDDLGKNDRERTNAAPTPAIVTILDHLAKLASPRDNPDSTCIQALSLINIALETGSAMHILHDVADNGLQISNDNADNENNNDYHTDSQRQLLSILQNDLCRHLLQLSTHFDPAILSLTLRVIFNLFNSLKNHLKVQLEVFLTSVHLRILKTGTPERRELVLESLIEFCHEPALMRDLYTNYDCDMGCTNLFENICLALAHHARGEDDRRPLNALNRLALEGVLIVIDDIARRCRPDDEAARRARDVSAPPSLVGGARDDDDDGAASEPSSSFGSSSLADDHPSDADDDDDDDRWLHRARERTALVLVRRKRRKHRRSLVVQAFARNPIKEWIPYAESVRVLPSPATPAAVAEFLRATPGLDKEGVGAYLSKGPADRYPFHAEVRREFVGRFSFRGMDFATALRTFLRTFRLPGEAQCIDRLMEAFAEGLYEQQRDDDGAHPLFRNSDAAYVMAFSTIMLNTDLHNPNMRDDRRMTIDQFVSTNRGINDGENFPEEFLRDLYHAIRVEEIQVRRELGDDVPIPDAVGGVGGDGAVDGDVEADDDDRDSQRRRDYSRHLDGLLSNRDPDEVSAPFFTPVDAARRMSSARAGVHERDMFASISSAAIRCASSMLVRSRDDATVVRAVRGLERSAAVCAYFGTDGTFNEIVTVLLGYGRDYATSCVDGYGGGPDEDEDEDEWEKEDGQEEEEGGAATTTTTDGDRPNDSPRRHYYADADDVDDDDDADDVPYALLRASDDDKSSDSDDRRLSDHELVRGAAAHRGLVSLRAALGLVRAHPSLVREAWAPLVECLLAARDANALPAGLAELDDFADHRGVRLPPSPFATRATRRAEEYARGGGEEDRGRPAGFWGSVASLFGGPRSDGRTDGDAGAADAPPNAFAAALSSVCESAGLDRLFSTRIRDAAVSMRVLHALLEARNVATVDERDLRHPLFERHAVVALELAARTLLWNHPRTTSDAFSVFHARLEGILSRGRVVAKENKEENKEEEEELFCPYLMERAAVTVLRAFIHLHDVPQIKPRLLSCMSLLNEMSPRFLEHVADRLGCGMAIILRGTFLHRETDPTWNTLTHDLLDTAASYRSGRGFVFDGIASCVEQSFPTRDGNENDDDPDPAPMDEDETMSVPCARSLTRLLCKFVVGDYDGDTAASIPAMFCLGKLCVHLSRRRPRDPLSVDAHDEALRALHAAISSPDPRTARAAVDRLHDLVVSDAGSLVRDDAASRTRLLDALSARPPPSADAEEAVRVRSFDLLGRLLLLHLSDLDGADEEHLRLLADVVRRTAATTAEYLDVGRRAGSTTLFESTVQLVTNLSNVLLLSSSPSSSPGENDAGATTTTTTAAVAEFRQWAGRALFDALDEVGAGGGSSLLLAATTSSETNETDEVVAGEEGARAT